MKRLEIALERGRNIVLVRDDEKPISRRKGAENPKVLFRTKAKYSFLVCQDFLRYYAERNGFRENPKTHFFEKE